MQFLRRFAARNRWVLVVLTAVVAVALAGTAVLAIRHGAGRAAGARSVPSAPGSARPTAASPPVAANTSAPAASPSAIYVVTEPARGAGVLGNDPKRAPIAGGQTDHLKFAGQVAAALLAYDSETDFRTRNADLMQLALPEPYGDPSGLATDLARYTPTGRALSLLRASDEHVTWRATSVRLDQWAENRIRALGGPTGAHGIDVTGVQTVETPGQPAATVPVQLSMTVVCPPTTAACGLDRIFSGPLRQALTQP